jgi:hypothetical protein
MSDHGTTSRYRNEKCRCDQCRAAHSAYMADLRQRNRAKQQATPPRSWPAPERRLYGPWAFDIEAAIERAADAAVPRPQGYRNREIWRAA